MVKKLAELSSWELLRRETDGTGGLDYIPSDALDTFKAGLGSYVMDGCYGFWMEPGAEGHSDPSKLVITLGKRIDALCGVYNGKSTQSPIEDMLLGALVWLDMDWCGFPSASIFSGPAEQMEVFGPRDEIGFWICPQAAIGPYRVDALVWFSFGRTLAGLAVECDGHAFHEKTKEQASRDKRRDREILRAGFPVVRFSGSDIYKSPADCVEQIRDLLDDARDRVSRAAGLYA